MTEADFIELNKNNSLPEIALQLSKTALDKDFVLSQINGFQKAKNKLPEFYNTQSIIYPPKLSIEQCSSEKTGIYKSNLIKGDSLIDLTGGFGIDSFYFSKQFKQVTYVEQNKELFNVVRGNFKNLKANNIELLNCSAEDFLETTSKKVDVVYIDPSRRNKNQRVFKLNECVPNIIELASEIFNISDKILVKTSPLLDIKQSLIDLKYVSTVWVISVDNDCKEVLYLLEMDAKPEAQIHTINLSKQDQHFSFGYEQEQSSRSPYYDPQYYLYEPNVSILKAGAFNSISEKYNLNKLAPNTHLYTSETLIENFPGRNFKVEQVLPYSPKYFKKLGITKANVSCRNFKDKPEEVKKKLKIKDGGETYLFATTDSQGKPILIFCVK